MKISKRQFSIKNKDKGMLEFGLPGFISDHVCGCYSVDGADPFAKIAIEVDNHNRNGCPRDFEGDKKKETYLKNRGWIIFHIKEHEIKKDKYTAIESIRTVQEKRRKFFRDKIKQSFSTGTLKVKGFDRKNEKVDWFKVSDVMEHKTHHKDIYLIETESSSVKVTEDHSLFLFDSKREVKASELSVGDRILNINYKDEVEGKVIKQIKKTSPLEETYDLSVPGVENFRLHSGILAHNSYSISGVSLDIDKSSKYEAMKNNFLGEYDKAKDDAKRSIKIVKGLKQPRYGIGISSALGPYSSPGVQSRRNFVSGFRGGQG